MTTIAAQERGSETVSKSWFEDQYSAGIETGKDRWLSQERASQRYRYGLSLGLIEGRVKERGGQDFLDLGCGMGEFAAMIHSLNPGNRMHGQDISENAVMAAGRKHPGFSFRAGALPTVAFDGPFAGISALECICYLGKEERMAVFRNIAARLAAGGWFLFSVPIRKGPYAMDIPEVEACFAGAGLVLEKISFNHAMPYYGLESRLMSFWHAQVLIGNARSGILPKSGSWRTMSLARLARRPIAGALLASLAWSTALTARWIMSWDWPVILSQRLARILAEKPSRSHILALGRKN